MEFDRNDVGNIVGGNESEREPKMAKKTKIILFEGVIQKEGLQSGND